MPRHRLLRAPALATALLVLTPAHAAAQAPPLAVLRHAPVGEAGPAAVFEVALDRAIRRDGAPPPERVLQVSPAVAGTYVWADPATLRFVPTRPLAPGRYEVTLHPGLVGVDGGRLAQPVVATAVVRGPKRLGSVPQLQLARDPHPSVTLAVRGELRLAYDAPVDSLALRAMLHFDRDASPRCRSAMPTPMRVVRQRPFNPADQWAFGVGDRESPASRFRTEVVLAPVAPVPE